MDIKIRRGTAAEWNINNYVLAAGELGYETGTKRLKIGDGTTPWRSLAYVARPEWPIAAITGLQGELDRIDGNINDLSGVIDTKAGEVHTHAISDTTGLQPALDTKTSITQVARVPSTLNGAYTRYCAPGTLPPVYATGGGGVYIDFGSGTYVTDVGPSTNTTVTYSGAQSLGTSYDPLTSWNRHSIITAGVGITPSEIVTSSIIPIQKVADILPEQTLLSVYALTEPAVPTTAAIFSFSTPTPKQSETPSRRPTIDVVKFEGNNIYPTKCEARFSSRTIHYNLTETAYDNQGQALSGSSIQLTLTPNGIEHEDVSGAAYSLSTTGLSSGYYRTVFLLLSAPYTVYSPVYSSFSTSGVQYVRQCSGFTQLISPTYFPDTNTLETAKQYTLSTAIASVPVMCSAMLDRAFSPFAKIVYNSSGSVVYEELLVPAPIKTDGSNSPSTTINWAGHGLASPTLLTYSEAVYTVPPLGGNAPLTINCTNGNVQDYTFNAYTASIIQFSNAPVAGKLYSITLVLHGAAGKVGGFNSAIKWSNGELPDLSSGTDVLNFFTYDGGITWYGSLAMSNVL
jgi:hypothetical protein